MDNGMWQAFAVLQAFKLALSSVVGTSTLLFLASVIVDAVCLFVIQTRTPTMIKAEPSPQPSASRSIMHRQERQRLRLSNTGAVLLLICLFFFNGIVFNGLRSPLMGGLSGNGTVAGGIGPELVEVVGPQSASGSSLPGIVRLHHAAAAATFCERLNVHRHCPYPVASQVIAVNSLLYMRLDGVAPWRLRYRVDPLPASHFQIEEYARVRTPTEFEVSFHERPFALNATSTGIYSLVSVNDRIDHDGFVSNSTVTVVLFPYAPLPLPARPPTAHFVYRSVMTKCVGDATSTLLRLSGEAPFSISIDRYFNGEPATRRIETKVRDFVDVSALSLPAEIGYLSYHYWRMPLSDAFVNGVYEWRVVSVTDARNMTVSYFGSDRTPTFRLHLLPRPTVRGPLQSVVLAAQSERDVPLELTGRGPFTVSYSTPLRPLVRHAFELPTSAYIKVNEAGTYTLISVADSVCEGTVLPPPSFVAVHAPSPTLALVGALPSSMCPDSPLNVTLELTGTAPWRVSVQWSSDRAASAQPASQIVVPHSPYSVLLTPRPGLGGGIATVSFVSLTDTYYDQVPIDVSLSVLVHQPAYAYFGAGAATQYLCLDEPLSLGVELEGAAPFSLTYSVRDSKHMVANITGDNTTLDIYSHIPARGRYTISLLSVRDGNECARTLSDTRTIIVDPVTASFECEPSGHVSGSPGAPILTTSYGASLPIRLVGGRAPFQVSLHVPGADAAAPTQKTIYSTDQSLVTLTESGAYRLLGVRDAHCPGSVQPPAECMVSLVTPPALRLFEAGPANACVGRPARIATLALSGGEAPWKVGYSVKLPRKSQPGGASANAAGPAVERRSLDVFSVAEADDVALVDTPLVDGSFVYVIESVSDRYHGVVNVPATAKATASVLVHRNPTVELALRKPAAGKGRPADAGTPPGTVGIEMQHCRGQEARIPLRVFGVAPFVITYSIRSADDARTFTRTLELPTGSKAAATAGFHDGELVVNELDRTGVFSIVIEKIVDATGCWTETETSVMVSVGDVPTITVQGPGHVCVGDPIEIFFGPASDGPWEMSYSFGGEARSRRSTRAHLFLEAKQDGVMHITRVSTKHCSRDVDVTVTVRARPHATLNGGRVSEIYARPDNPVPIEIDILRGTGPFNITIMRDAFHEPTTELYHINSVAGPRTRFIATKEGEYRLHSLEDTFCTAHADHLNAQVSGRGDL